MRLRYCSARTQPTLGGEAVSGAGDGGAKPHALDAGRRERWAASVERALEGIGAGESDGEFEDRRWTPCYDCGVCPEMGTEIQTEIQVGPRWQKLHAAQRGVSHALPARPRANAGPECPGL